MHFILRTPLIGFHLLHDGKVFSLPYQIVVMHFAWGSLSLIEIWLFERLTITALRDTMVTLFLYLFKMNTPRELY